MINQHEEVTRHLKTFASSRRQFLRASAIAGGLMAAGQFVPSTVAGLALGRAAAQEGDPISVLNYALTLEHLENRMYQVIIDSGVLSGQAQTYAEVYGAHESAHVDLITKTINQLGGTPVEEQESYTFPNLTSEQQTIELLVTVEDLGAAAYLGAAPMLIENDDLLTAAVRIHTNEAWHATGWRALAFFETEPTALVPFAFAEGKSMEEVLEIVAGFGVMAGMPDTGAGGLATKGQGANVLGVAGLGAVAAAGVGIARSRAAREARQS